MMLDKNACSEKMLQSLLTGDESSHDYRSALRHVDACSSCQIELEKMAADPAVWTETQSVLSSSDQPPTDKGEHPDPPLPWDHQPTAWDDSMVGQLLSSPSHPEMLGRIGRYDVERLIGTGGMGVVLKAHDTELNRPVAVKLLAPYLAQNGSARKRFAREARAAAAVVDEHVVAIHNVESGDDPEKPPFLVMKFIAGGSLQQRLDRDGPLDVCEALRIGMQTAKGLAAAHAQGLIHRDIKPANILLDEGVERALLTDFGLARAEDDACLTRSGFHPGTPHYMSPEQVRGETIDARSDLFGLGCVLYAMCTGHPPFRAESSYGVLRRITDEPARPIREINPTVPVWLERIVSKLLSKSREDRFESAEQIAEVLKDCLAHVNAPITNPLPRIYSRLSWLKRCTSIMNDKRILSLFSISLFVAAVVLPWPIAAVARDELALMFSGSALLLAFFFAILSRSEYLGRVVLWTTGGIIGLLAVATVALVPLYYWRSTELRHHAIQAERAALAEMRSHQQEKVATEAIRSEKLSRQIAEQMTEPSHEATESIPPVFSSIDDAATNKYAINTRRRDENSVSPFTDVQFDGEKIIVSWANKDHQWLEIDGIKVEDIVASSKRQFGELWQKRIAEDLVELMEGMNKRPGDTVELRLLDLDTNQELEVAKAKMTVENRAVIYQNRREAEEK